MPLFVEGTAIDSNVHTVEDFLRRYGNITEHSRKYVTGNPRELTQKDKVLYVNQREFATFRSDDQNIRYVGTDDTTTCHIVVLQDEHMGISSLGHFDGSQTESGLKNMLMEIQYLQQKYVDDEKYISTGAAVNSNILKIHIFGGFCDEGNYSEKLFKELLKVLNNLTNRIEMSTACVYSVNNTYDGRFNRPIIYGIGIDVRTGEIFSAHFKYKGPDEALRHARIFGSSPEMLSVYDFENGFMRLVPFHYRVPPQIEFFLLLGDNEILRFLSTSPHCEPPDFVDTTRQSIKWLLKHPDPSETVLSLFKNGMPRLYKLNDKNEWVI